MRTDDYRLNESQLKAFLHAEGLHVRLADYLEQLPGRVDGPVRSILDCGGGNGILLDRLLESFPEAQGVLIDGARFMLDRNTSHPRKRLIHGNLECLSKLLPGQCFDLIFLSDILHHCIVSGYRETRELQTAIVQSTVRLLSPGGRIVVCERIMDSRFDSQRGDDFSARLTYRLTRCKTLSALVRFFGANTAGLGVCFFSTGQFEALCRDSKLEIVETLWIDEKDRQSRLRQLQLLALSARSIKYTLFLLKCGFSVQRCDI